MRTTDKQSVDAASAITTPDARVSGDESNNSTNSTRNETAEATTKGSHSFRFSFVTLFATSLITSVLSAGCVLASEYVPEVELGGEA